MKALARVATILFVAAIPVFLVTANVRFAASETWFYRQGFRNYNADEATGVSLSQLDASAADIVRYFEDDRGSLRMQVSIGGQDVSLFNQQETDHMRDVKSLMKAVYRLNEVSLAIILAYVGGVVLWARERSVRDLARYSLYGVASGLVVVAVIGAFALTGFDQAWTTFHEIVFRNDLWKLNPATDRLIQMFPEPFWKDMTIVVGGLTAAEALAVVAVSTTYLVRGRDRRVAEPVPIAVTAERRAS
jgi:integral membrane protein (TIGR01906 family)